MRNTACQEPWKGPIIVRRMKRRARDNFGRLLEDWMAAVSSPDDNDDHDDVDDDDDDHHHHHQSHHHDHDHDEHDDI